MSYVAVAEKLKTIPEQYLDEVSDFLDGLQYKIGLLPASPKKDTSFIDAMQGILPHEDVEDIRKNRHLKFKGLPPIITPI